jgi:hypothetical protein
MSIAELLTGSVVFSLSAGASLQLWALASAATLQQERLQQRMDQADAALISADVALRRFAAAASVGGGAGARGGDCGEVADRLAQELAAMPAAPGLERQLQRPGAGDRVLLSLVVEGLTVPRQRLLVPAALGLCGTPTAAEAPGGRP